MHAGEELVVSHLDGPGLVVSPINTKDEQWIPASLVPNSAISRIWSFRPRKMDFIKSESFESCKHTSYEKMPVILNNSTIVRAVTGEVIRLSVETENAEGAIVTWKKQDDDQCIKKNERYQFQQAANFVYLQIIDCRPSDSGIYHCHIQCDNGSCSTKISLSVVGMQNIIIYIIIIN